MYSYTQNNPIMYTDISGYAPEWIKNILTGAAIIVTVAAISAIIIASGGTAAFLPAFFSAFGSALQTGFTIATLAGGVSGTIRTSKSLFKHISQRNSFEDTISGMGKSFLYGFGDGFLAGSKYYAATSVVGMIGNVVSSKIDFGNGFGYGYQTSQFMIGYQNPSVIGFTLFASLIRNKFRIEIDPLHSIHYHYGPSKSIRNLHRGYWIGGIFVGFFAGCSGEVY